MTNCRAKALNHILKALEWQNLDYVAGRLGFESRLFFREGIDAFACLGGSLFLDDHFAEIAHEIIPLFPIEVARHASLANLWYFR